MNYQALLILMAATAVCLAILVPVVNKAPTSTVEQKTNAAKSLAKKLKLLEPIVVCDPSYPLRCACFVSHGPSSNRHVEAWSCSGK